MSMRDKERVVLSGTFNPLHWGHEALLSVGHRITNLPPLYEMSTVHWTKANVDWSEIVERQLQFQHKSPLILTDAAFYWQKAERLPNTVFVTGWDSVQVTLDEEVVSKSVIVQTMESFRDNNCSFLVAAREVNGELRTFPELTIPEGYEDLFQPIPVALFKDSGMSSTKMRRLLG